MIDKNSKYLKFIDEALALAKEVPRYFSKFSKKIFCNHQKIIMLVLKQKLRTTYRDLIEILKITNIPMYIGLKRIPHHTTLVKFSRKIKPRWLNMLLPCRKARATGIDGTGFEVENKSMHYQMRTAISSYRRYIKLGISADLDRQLIMKHSIHKSPRNDNKDFMPLTRGIKTDLVCADKGYDATKHHEFVIRDLNAISCIKVREKLLGKAGRSTLRKRILREFDESMYHQRSKVESIFSSMKRKYGSCLMARRFSTQKVEVICKLIAYNVDRATLYLLDIMGCQQSLKGRLC